MQKLNSELNRLYLQPGANPAGAPALVAADGNTRAITISFNPASGEDDGEHWTRLCAVANALQTELGLPAPAVSITGTGYRLWLSLETPMPEAKVAHFLTLLGAAHPQELDDHAGAGAPAQLPPYALASGEQWAAFIHPELGASFASEPALDIEPPQAGQAALLEGLHSISAQQFAHAMLELEARQAHTMQEPEARQAPAPKAAPSPALEPAPAPSAAAPQDLLLKDATLEDIVRFLHARNIEPTFRHLLPK
ncbi:hypothetical protein H3H37_13305 [Duganella sp. LX20W]|uniref:Uncharacterized protein n=1 Tax=Rugamonas brunnea TaxID=2758569 RepID=A0A7W2ESX4_9BURK|nr:hypothetical protein [Rugamonas brunnea]MBA5638032.1 hypothetical protein [Rugamonas brunnea]